jgi:hypothetical protein
MRVLDVLLRFATNGLVCQTTGTLAKAADLSTDTVARRLKEFVASGHLVPTGLRSGKAVQYRLVESPQATGGSPHPITVVETPAAAAPNGAAAGRVERRTTDADAEGKKGYWKGRNRSDSALSEEAKAWADAEWPPDEERRAFAVELRAWMHERWGLGGDVVGLPDSGQGACPDCGGEDDLRRYGSLDLCRECIGRRQALAFKLGEGLGLA